MRWWLALWLLLSGAAEAQLAGLPPGAFDNAAARAPMPGGSIAFNWSNQTALPYLAGGTSWSIGTTNAAGSCGTFTAGDLLIAVETVWTNGAGDPGTLTVPSGWSSVWTNLESDTRTAVFSKSASGSESCSTGFASSWTTTSVSRAWVLLDYSYTGSAPGSAVDTSSSQGLATGASPNMVAPSTSPTNSNDLLLGIFTEGGGAGPYTLPLDMTSVANTAATGGNTAEILIGSKVLTVSGATGTETATMTGTFKNTVNGLVALNQ